MFSYLNGKKVGHEWVEDRIEVRLTGVANARRVVHRLELPAHRGDRRYGGRELRSKTEPSGVDVMEV
jgi:hypothetical protein